MHRYLFHMVPLAIVGVLVTGLLGQGIVGSSHDFSGYGWSGGGVCAPFHTPHRAADSISAPLWSHDTTAATYTVNDASGTEMAASEALDTVSLLCMSCHDGTVALDSFGGATGNQYISGNALIGTDLRNDHPVGVTGNYDQAVIDHPGQYADKAVLGLPLYVLNNADSVSCGTCHDVHGSPNPPLLRLSTAGGELCLTCHQM